MLWAMGMNLDMVIISHWFHILYDRWGVKTSVEGPQLGRLISMSRPVHTGSRVLSPKSFKVNTCNLNGWEYGSWDSPHHIGSWVLSSKSLGVNMCNLSDWEYRNWDLPLQMGSQVWHGCLHDNKFWRWGSGIVLRVGSSKKDRSNPTLTQVPPTYLHKLTKIRRNGN